MNNETDIEKVKELISYLKQSDDEEDNEIALSIENILVDRERLEREKDIHIKLEQQYKKEYLDIKNKYDSLVEKVKKKVRYFEENEEFIATGITDINDNYSDGTVIKRFIDTLQELLDTEKEKI